MSNIRCIYHDGAPRFPATAHHPQAARYTVQSAFLGRDVLVDALGGEPTTAEVDALLTPPTADQIEAQVQAVLNGGSAQHLDPFKLLKAKFISDLAFRLGKAPGSLTGAELTAERNRIAAIYKAL